MSPRIHGSCFRRFGDRTNKSTFRAALRSPAIAAAPAPSGCLPQRLLGWGKVASQEFPGARASGRPVGKAGEGRYRPATLCLCHEALP
jgi:hypothetical protein